MGWIFDYVTTQWRCRNDENFLAAENCFKIVTCDPLDDTVDQFVNVMTGVAKRLCQTDYSEAQWNLFFESILYLVEYEHRQYQSLTQE